MTTFSRTPLKICFSDSDDDKYNTYYIRVKPSELQNIWLVL